MRWASNLMLVWRTSILYGVHQYCMVYINIMWCTSILCGVHPYCILYGVHQYCMAYINIVWRTSILCGVHQYCVAYINNVWCTSILCGVHPYSLVCRSVTLGTALPRCMQRQATVMRWCWRCSTRRLNWHRHHSRRSEPQCLQDTALS